MVLPLPTRPMTILVVAKSEGDGNDLRYGLQDCLGSHAGMIELSTSLQQAEQMFARVHYDVVIAHGWDSNYAEAFVLRIRALDGKRHTGVLVLGRAGDGFDRMAVRLFQAGADDVLAMNLSLLILKSKIFMVFHIKVATDLLRTVNHKLQRLIVTDELTGLSNMRGFHKKYTQIMDRCMKGEFGAAVMMMDLDRFKKVNDNFNHLVGSHVIRSVGHILLENSVLGDNDVAARYGGDEYVLILVGKTAQEQMEKARAIRAMIEKSEFSYDKWTVRVTASIGVAWVERGFTGSREDLVKAADAMLYRSKEHGRNRVSGMVLKYPIDFEHIGSAHLIEGDAGSSDDSGIHNGVKH